MGRIDFLRNEKEYSDIQLIKVMDIRKNEQFGDIHIFSENPCPFTLKASSRIVELFLLRKYNAMNISRNFPNIWRRIETKSYHNLVSIKKLTFKILKQYYNTHCYNKNEKETNFAFSLDVTKNFQSELSTLENKPSIHNKKRINKSQNKSVNVILNQNLNKTMNKEKDRKNILEKIELKPSKTKYSINKKKLFIGYNSNIRKSSAEILNDNLHLISDTMSNSNLNSFRSSNFKFSKFTNSLNPVSPKKDFPIINIKKDEEDDGKDKVPLLINKNSFLHLHKNTDIKNILNKRSNDNFTFQNDNQSNKFTITSHNKLRELKISLKNSSLIKNSDIMKSNLTMKQQSNKTINSKSFIENQTLKYKGNNNKDILTLEDINKKNKKKIRKKLKKRKKIQKLRELLRLQRLKINKSLQELYKYKLGNNNIIKINSNEIQNYNQNNSNSTISLDKKMISKIIENSSSEESSIVINNNNLYFNSNSLKIISLESLEIHSCYKNIYKLTKGKIIENKFYFENLIKKYSNKILSNEDKYQNIKKNASSFSPKFKNNRNRLVNFKIYRNTKNKANKNDSISEDKKSISSKSKKNLLVEDNDILNKYYIAKKSETTLEKSSNSLIQNNKNSSILEKQFEKIKALNEYQKNKIGVYDKRNIKIKNEINIYNGNIIETKQFFKTKKLDKQIQEQTNNDSNNINDKGLTSSINAFNFHDKDNKMTYLNRDITNFSSKRILDNKLEKKKKNRRCYIF